MKGHLRGVQSSKFVAEMDQLRKDEDKTPTQEDVLRGSADKMGAVRRRKERGMSF